jgi:endogenous inhibitor of DNA gyrase (YacG/DUF329 family)
MPTCPTCKTPVAADAETFPFCQARCKLLDLGNWLTGRYVVSSPVSLDETPPGGFGFAPPSGPRVQGGSLKVVTTNLSGGWLRRNGAPYSAEAVVTEYFDRFPSPNDEEWLVVTTIVDDPAYLNQPYITSSHFKREQDGSKWRPTGCVE